MVVVLPGVVVLAVYAGLLSLLTIPVTTAFGIPDFLEFGSCSPIKVVPEINFERYSGIWFSIENVPNEYTSVTSCSMTNYTWTGDLMTVMERGLDHEGRKVQRASVMRRSEDQPGVLTVEADGVPSAPYVVVGTDYDNYACVHSCMDFMAFRAAFSWVFTRQPTPDHSYLQLCRDIFENNDIDQSSMEPMKQGKDCPYAEKLNSLLVYSQSIQSKAKAKALKDGTKLVAAVSVPGQTGDSINHTHPHHHNKSTNVHERLKTFMDDEKKHIEELEEEERRLMRTLEAELRRESEEIQDLRSEIIQANRKHHYGQERTSGSDKPRQSSLVVLGVVSALLTTTWL